MNHIGENWEERSKLKKTHYEHTILVSHSLLSSIELFTLTLLSSYLYFEWLRNDISLEDKSKIIGVILLLIIIVRLLVKTFWGVKIESIFIVKGLGLQKTTVYHSNFKSSVFIPWHSINDVIINEAIIMQKVIFYLAVLVKAECKQGEEIIPIFTHAQPRLPELKKIYTNIQLILLN